MQDNEINWDKPLQDETNAYLSRPLTREPYWEIDGEDVNEDDVKSYILHRLLKNGAEKFSKDSGWGLTELAYRAIDADTVDLGEMMEDLGAKYVEEDE